MPSIFDVASPPDSRILSTLVATVWRTDQLVALCGSAPPKPVLVSKIRAIARDSALPPLRLTMQR